MNHQVLVDGYFQASAPFWRDIYNQADVLSRAYQLRFTTVLEQIRHLGLPPGAPALEVGCGAGHTTAALAARGFKVEALDAAQAMVDATQARIHAAGVSTRAHTSLGNIHHLPFPDSTFSLAVAVGVLPWLADRDRAVAELTRVVDHRGFVLLTTDNSRSLTHLLDPSLNPLVHPLKRTVARLLRPDVARATFCPNSDVDRTLARHGLRKLWSTTVGFGPFTFLNCRVLPARAGEWLQEYLQQAVSNGSTSLRNAGSHYIVLAQKNSLNGKD